MTDYDHEALGRWLAVAQERLRRLTMDELAALRLAFGSAWFTSQDVRERPELVAAIGASRATGVGARLRDLKAVGEKGGLRLESGKRARNAGLRWTVRGTS